MATMMVKAAFGALGIHWVVVPMFGERVFPLFAVRLHGRPGRIARDEHFDDARGARRDDRPHVGGRRVGGQIIR